MTNVRCHLSALCLEGLQDVSVCVSGVSEESAVTPSMVRTHIGA